MTCSSKSWPLASTDTTAINAEPDPRLNQIRYRVWKPPGPLSPAARILPAPSDWRKGHGANGRRLLRAVRGDAVRTRPADSRRPRLDCQLAALPEALFTTWFNFFVLMQLKPGESALIHGATSGVGSIATQLLNALGHKVYGTAGTADKRKSRPRFRLYRRLRLQRSRPGEPGQAGDRWARRRYYPRHVGRRSHRRRSGNDRG